MEWCTTIRTAHTQLHARARVYARTQTQCYLERQPSAQTDEEMRLRLMLLLLLLLSHHRATWNLCLTARADRLSYRIEDVATLIIVPTMDAANRASVATTAMNRSQTQTQARALALANAHTFAVSTFRISQRLSSTTTNQTAIIIIINIAEL